MPALKRAPRPTTSAYLGDARVGAGANIGAGTITCNYDGFDKHCTDIGAGAFIGSNSALVAPVRVGDGAYVGAGSAIAKDVDGQCAGRDVRAEQTETFPAGRRNSVHGRKRRRRDEMIGSPIRTHRPPGERCAGAKDLRLRRGQYFRSLSRGLGVHRMCGIVGIRQDAAPVILEALKRLEYRGYDSAGIATLVDGHIERRRAPGKLSQLATRAARRSRWPAAPASATRAGPPMARPPKATPIPMPRRAWRWCITASSRISASCATN